MTTIERMHATGIVRAGSPERGFRYRTKDGRKVRAKDLARIDQLKIPPAWTDVAINPGESGRVQAIGKDAAGRWQYLYHQTQIRTRERKKFLRLIRFAQSMPTMRRVVAGHLRKPGLTKERVMAGILRILSMSFMRPISGADAVLEAKVLRLGRTLAFCTCDVREPNGTKVAAFSTGTYAIIQ